MSGSAQSPAGTRWLAEIRPLLRELFSQSGAERFGLTEPAFSQILAEAAQKYLPATAGAKEAGEFCRGLKLEELALARACAAGIEAAWEVFLTRYREKLYDAAWAIAREDSAARELADSLYANLYGMNERDGRRVSKLASYMGRGSLEGWLRTVLAQEHVDRYRSRRRLVSLDEEEEAGHQFIAAQPVEEQPADPKLVEAVDHALGNLPAEDRYVLASYFLDERTLAEIAKSLGVHESTISRRLDKITRTLHSAVRDGLLRQGMSRRQAEEALEVDVRDLQVNLRARLGAQDGPVKQRNVET
jgi:RNA polymerase sigma-70 factor, ECF subfamily